MGTSPRIPDLFLSMHFFVVQVDWENQDLMGGVPELSLLLGEEFHPFFSFKSLIFSKEFQGVIDAQV